MAQKTGFHYGSEFLIIVWEVDFMNNHRSVCSSKT